MMISLPKHLFKFIFLSSLLGTAPAAFSGKSCNNRDIYLKNNFLETFSYEITYVQGAKIELATKKKYSIPGKEAIKLGRMDRDNHISLHIEITPPLQGKGEPKPCAAYYFWGTDSGYNYKLDCHLQVESASVNCSEGAFHITAGTDYRGKAHIDIR